MLFFLYSLFQEIGDIDNLSLASKYYCCRAITEWVGRCCPELGYEVSNHTAAMDVRKCLQF